MVAYYGDTIYKECIYMKNNNKEDQKKRGKGRKPYKKGRNSRDSRPDSKGNTSNTTTGDSNLPSHDSRHDNDISFWNGTGQIYKDATTISTFKPAGSREISSVYTHDYYTPTGIARFDYMPFFGDVDGPIHPINMVARVVYNAINAKNSKMPRYDPSDLMIYILAVAQAWSLWAWVSRIVGMFPTFSVLNRYWWEPICESMGLAPITTDNDITKWRNLANKMALKLNTFAVPVGIPYFDRSRWMNTNIYMDSPVGKATYYYFNPATILKYSRDNDKIGSLDYSETPWHKYLKDPANNPVVTPKVVEEYFNDLISNLSNDSDIPDIATDITRAFEGRLYTVPQLTEAYQIFPLYTPEVNLELHNARIHYGAACLADGTATYGKFDIHQDMNLNCLRSSNPNWRMVSDISTGLAVTDTKAGRAVALDFPIDNPGNDDWMTATRLTWVMTGDVAGGDSGTMHACTEILINDSFYEFHDDNGAWVLSSMDQCINLPATNANTMRTSLTKFARSSKLNDAPITYVIQPAGDSGQYLSPAYMEIISDLSNYAPVSVENIIQMHDAAQTSVFLPDWLRGII